MLGTLQRSWDKNWPELRAALRGELPGFVLSPDPEPLDGALPVFCYHVVEPASLEADLRFLEHNGYTTLNADQVVAHLRGQWRAPNNAVVLTFDDAPANLYKAAYPSLLKHGMVAIVFVAGAFPIESDAPDHRDSMSSNENGNGYHPARHVKRNGHGSGTGVDGDPRRPVTWQELQTMEASGLVDVQCHTYQHRYVPRWPEPRPLTGVDPVWVESRRSPTLSLSGDLVLGRRILERRLNKTVRHLALPDYDGTPEALRLVHRLGYRSCWWGLCPGRALNRPGQSPYRIVRLSGEFVRRLPGEGRRPLGEIFRQRYGASLRRWVTPRSGRD